MIGTILVLSLALGGAPQPQAASAQNPPAAVQPPNDPYDQRPACESMFLASDWQLTAKQTACDWIRNRVFSTPAFLGAVWSAEMSPVVDRIIGRARDPHGFARRFATDFGQNAFKSTGAYL